jgi:hypothetical protein
MKSSSFTIDFEKLAEQIWQLIEDPTFNPYKYKGVADGFLTNIVYNQKKTTEKGTPLWDGPAELANMMAHNEDDHQHYEELVNWFRSRALKKAVGSNEGS